MTGEVLRLTLCVCCLLIHNVTLRVIYKEGHLLVWRFEVEGPSPSYVHDFPLVSEKLGSLFSFILTGSFVLVALTLNST